MQESTQKLAIDKKQNIIFAVYVALVILIVVLRIVRKNPEFLFFGGVIASLFIIYNYQLFQSKKHFIYYFLISILMAASWFTNQAEMLAFVFPLVTLCFVGINRVIFMQLKKREPIVDITLGASSDKLYTLYILLIAIFIYIVLILKYLTAALV